MPKCCVVIGRVINFTVCTDDDPLSAVCETGYDVQIARPDATLGHRSSGTLRCDATHFILDQTLEVLENGTVIHARSWSERIPRDHV